MLLTEKLDHIGFIYDIITFYFMYYIKVTKNEYTNLFSTLFC